MKIENSFAPTTASLAPRNGSKSVSSAAQQDAVSLSSLAGSLQSGDEAPVDRARIEEIKQAISQGRFEINSGAIADRLIETARGLVNSQQGKSEA